LATNNNVHDFPKKKSVDFLEAHTLLKNGYLDQAESIAKKLVDDGFYDAYALLGAIYEKRSTHSGYGMSDALFYYKKAIEKVGAVEAWLALGRLHYLGLCGELDKLEAIKIYQIVREDCNHPVANLMLGKIYLDGKIAPQDFDLAPA